ncbi:MAG: hypothetical protein H0W53_07265 [Acidobacteria bacterium]|nr:hypothetical protein [Acidobacteriota bacterium]
MFGSAAFRCFRDHRRLECPIDDPVPDGIQADGPLPYDATDGATIDSLGEFALQPVSNGRFLLLDFSHGSATCGAACRRTFATIQIDCNNLTVFHTNVIDPATGAEAADGLRSIPVGATWPSRVKIAFNTTGAAGEEIRLGRQVQPPRLRAIGPCVGRSHQREHVGSVRQRRRTRDARVELLPTEGQHERKTVCDAFQGADHHALTRPM